MKLITGCKVATFGGGVKRLKVQHPDSPRLIRTFYIASAGLKWEIFCRTNTRLYGGIYDEKIHTYCSYVLFVATIRH